MCWEKGVKRCVTHCGECKEASRPHKSNVFHIDNPDMAYDWCVFRHSEPLQRGEYEITVKDNGCIAGTVCYRSRIVPRTQMKGKRRQSGGVL